MRWPWRAAGGGWPPPLSYSGEFRRSGQAAVSEPEGRGAAWTEERGTSDEGRRRSEGGMGRRAGPRRRAGDAVSAARQPALARPESAAPARRRPGDWLLA